VNAHVWWYTARASGLVAWALVTLSVLWGLSFAGRLASRPRPAWMLDLHRFLGGLSVAFVAVHVLGLSLDGYVHFGPAQLFVPFASSWRPVAVAWGIVGMYLLLAIEVTSLLMRHLPRRVWRGIHLTSFVLFVVATAHGLLSGTDVRNGVVRWCALGGTLAVANLLVLRAFAATSRAGAPAPRRARVAAAPRTATARR
jgi:predicted ferric reductase